MSAIPDHAEIYRKLHANRYEHVEQARRARTMDSDIRIMLDLMEILLYGTQEQIDEYRCWYFNGQSDT